MKAKTCDWCGKPINTEDQRHFELFDRVSMALVGFHNTYRYDLCSASCLLLFSATKADKRPVRGTML